MGTPLQAARKLDSYGFNVLPASAGGKAPQVAWQRFQEHRTSDKLKVWFAGAKARNFWIMTGRISGIVVLDCDNEAAVEWWAARVGQEVLDETTAVKTANGIHFYFAYPDQLITNWSKHEDDIHFDLRSDGTGVIAPPSIHESGHEYKWIRDPASMVVAPDGLRRTGDDTRSGEGDGGRSHLTELLGRPPAKGGRNDWLARVAGHYAKTFYPLEDAYRTHVELANRQLADPLEEAEVLKTMESIWNAEFRKKDGKAGGEATLENGYLLGNGDEIFVQTRRKVGEQWTTDIQHWADFDIVAVGVVEDEEANRTYDVEINRKRQKDKKRALLPASKLSDSRALNPWLAEFGVTILPPDGMWPKLGSASSRLQRYIEAQSPPHFKVVDHLGWHVDGFVTHDGVIRQDGIHGFDRHQPNPRLRNWAPYRYGFADEKVAREVLAEVLTFHDQTVTAVFGAWWAACLLKPQVQAVTSQFPFMALEAPSESGKTTGFFSLMLALNGNTQGQVDPTRAALRDWMSAHQSGIVWVDDLSDTQHLMDLLRQATGEGSVGKKGEDRSTQEVVRLVAPICISGESLGLSLQKALVDRAVQLEVPSPTERRSLNNPDRLQWADIVDLKKRFPDLTDMAGTMVQLALRNEALIADIPKLAGEYGGRFGDKIGVLRMGARLLATMADDEALVERVDLWCAGQEALGNENTLTLKLIPQALARTNWQRRPLAAAGRWPSTPAFIDENDTVWFSPQALADWWGEVRHGRVEARTETAEMLAQQAKALGLGGAKGEGRKMFRLWDEGDRYHPSRTTDNRAYYWRLPLALSTFVLERSRQGTRISMSTVAPGSSERVTDGKGDRVTDSAGPSEGLMPTQIRLALEAEWRPE